MQLVMGCEEPNLVPQRKSAAWDESDDPKTPFEWSSQKKWLTMGLGLFAGFVCSVNGTILSVAHTAISQEFGVSDEPFPNSYWMTTSWGIGAAIIPLFLQPLTEDWGVRPVLLATYLCFTCLLIPIGLASNFVMLIIFRFFSGGCVLLITDAVASISANMFHGDLARSLPICLYVLIYLGATSFGPTMGASILQFLDWRWIGYIELIFTAALLPALFLALPETRAEAIQRTKAESVGKDGEKALDSEAAGRDPFHLILLNSSRRPVLMLITEPVVLVAAIWAAFSLSTLYLFTTSVEQVYRDLYGWTAIQAGYVQSAAVIGEILGTIFAFFVDRRWYRASAARNTKVPDTPIPEVRLYPAIVGGLFGVSGGMFVYGWTAYTELQWMGPTTGLAMVGFGSTAVIISLANYLIDAYARYAASALAAVGLVENVSIAFLPLAGPAVYTNLGFHRASTVLGCISLVLAAVPILVLKWGKEIRTRSPFIKEAGLVF